MEWQILKNEILFEHMEETIAAEIFRGKTYPWEVLPEIGAFIQKLGKTLSEEEYEKRGEDIWIAKSAKVFPTVYIHGPAIIGKNAEIRHCAFIRGNAIVGEGAVVGNSTELKNVILLVGDIILPEKDPPGSRLQKAADQIERSALTAAGRPQKPHQLPVRDLEGKTAYCRHLPGVLLSPAGKFFRQVL